MRERNNEDFNEKILCGQETVRANSSKIHKNWILDVIIRVFHSDKNDKNSNNNNENENENNNNENNYIEYKRKFIYNFLLFYTGYYDYNHSYLPNFKGMELFKKLIVYSSTKMIKRFRL